jgi:eukaryotic-like serine/threonine-protein kinase
MGAVQTQSAELIIDRYMVHDRIAAGGMAVVHLGRLLGQAGFSRTVALKRLHPQFATDPEFVAMFLDEAHLAARIQHPNVVAPLDVVFADGELVVVMEYVSGETLAQLLKTSLAQPAPTPAVIAEIMVGTLYGLHAAHEAVGEDGSKLNIVHRDVSPQNVIVGVDGVARVLDFGVAKAAMRSHVTKEGEVKGKIAYMAPEQLRGLALDRRADVFAAGVVFWEALAGKRLFRGEDLGQTVDRVLHGAITSPSVYNADLSPELEAVVMRALQRDPQQRYQTARDFVVAVERAITPATAGEVADWVKVVGGSRLAQRIERVAAIESQSSNRLRVGARSPLHTPWVLEEEGAGVDDAPTTRQPGSARETVPASVPVNPQPVEVIVATAATGSAPKRVTAKLLVALAALGVFVGGLAFATAHFGGKVASASAPKSDASPRAIVREPPAEALPASPAPLPLAQASTDSADPRTMQTAAPPKAVAPRSKATQQRLSAPAATPPSSKKVTRCDPPFYVDDKGIRRIKSECR